MFFSVQKHKCHLLSCNCFAVFSKSFLKQTADIPKSKKPFTSSIFQPPHANYRLPCLFTSKMLCRNFSTKSYILRRFITSNCTKRFCQNKSTKQPENAESVEESTSLGNMASKYVPFREKDAEEILDVNEERLKYTQMHEQRELEEVDPFKGLNLESIYLYLSCLAKDYVGLFVFRGKNRCL